MFGNKIYNRILQAIKEQIRNAQVEYDAGVKALEKRLEEDKIELEETLEHIYGDNSQVLNFILQKENKKLEDIENINLQKGEITFKEKKDAEPTRPDNKNVSDELHK